VLAVALGLPETAGTAWAARLRAQTRGASAHAAVGERSSQPHTVLTAADPRLPADGGPASPEVAASSEPAQRAGDPAPRSRAAVALAPLAQDDPSRIGSFRLLSRLGGGAMGEVFLAVSRAKRPVAVKRVRAEYARDVVPCPVHQESGRCAGRDRRSHPRADRRGHRGRAPVGSPG
jgi:hypothetical protein